MDNRAPRLNQVGDRQLQVAERASWLGKDACRVVLVLCGGAMTLRVLVIGPAVGPIS